MPRAGGEADKLGNRYETVWTVDSLLDVLTGEALGITVETLDEGLGVEFVKELPDGSREYHSVKRQTTDNTWRLGFLTRLDKSGRSILRDLFSHTARDPLNKACFVSTTTANDLGQLQEMAEQSTNAANFEKRLNAQSRLKGLFEDHLVKVGTSLEDRWDFLGRLRVVGLTENYLKQQVEQQIRQGLYHPDGSSVNPTAVRLLLGDFVWGRLGERIDRETLLDFLSSHSLLERDWQRDPTILETVNKRNQSYLRICENELIHGSMIVREEAAQAVAHLCAGLSQSVAIVGAAGLGKSCAVAQVVHSLDELGVPVLAIRLDLQTKALTTDALGRELGFPTSPAIVLAGLANGSHCVLVIDQIDALSIASGRNQDLWEVFTGLLEERKRYPKMRILLTCRAFDADHDSRLRDLLSDSSHCRRINLGFLPLEEVKAAVSHAGGDPEKLSSVELALLQIPQNLNLLLQGGPFPTGRPLSVQVLFQGYWRHKQKRVDQRLGRRCLWFDVVRTLTTWLSANQSLSAPLDILDEYYSDAEAMASEHVLVRDEKSWRFSHESLFDYAFARVYIASGGGSATRLLLDGNGDQHLFRRAQVRQILTYQRDSNFTNYLRDLQTLLEEPRVRVHLKKLVMDWLRSLPVPFREEWELVRSLHAHTPCSRWWKTVPHGSPGWFDLLLADGTWKAWLGSSEESDVDHALWLLSQKQIMLERSDQVAGLIEPFLDGSELWKKRFRTLLRFAEAYHGRRMFDLLLNAVRGGWYDTPEEGGLDGLYDLPQKSPDHAVELLAELIDRQCLLRPTGNPFENGGPCNALPTDYCAKLVEGSPAGFVEWVFPRVAREIVGRIASDEDGDYHDEIWHYLRFGEDYDFDSHLLSSLKISMRSLAATAPELLRKLTAPFIEGCSFTLGYLLLEAWRGNPTEFADESVYYLAKEAHRLDIGYSITGGGEGTAAVSRAAIEAGSPTCNADLYHSLESAILQFSDKYEAKVPQLRGRTQIILLSSLPKQRLSDDARKRLAELNRKFPNWSYSPPHEMRAEFVGPPIPDTALAKMKDEHWLTAMREYQSTRWETQQRFSKGSLHELSFELMKQARQQQERFGRLILAMEDGIRWEYFDAILRGLGRSGIAGAEGGKEDLSLTLIAAAIRHAHQLPSSPCGRAICSLLDDVAKEEIPEDLIDIVAYYAVHDPNPSEELWQAKEGGAPHWGGDPLSVGINSIRGGAACAVASLLFADKARWEQLRPAVDSLCSDRMISVRSCAVRCLLALLNIDRNEAVERFFQLISCADDILATAEIESFIHYAAYSHYDALRSLLREMLDHPKERARKTAAAQIALASFSQDPAKQDLSIVYGKDPVCRLAATKIFTHNVNNPSVGSECREQLKFLFSDPSEEVRKATSHCFHKISDDNLNNEVGLVTAYLDSPAFDSGCGSLVHALSNSTSLMPEIAVAIPNRIMDRLFQVDDPVRWRREAYELPELLLRVYQQTRDAGVKLECLDTIDRMLRAGFGDIESELEKVER